MTLQLEGVHFSDSPGQYSVPFPLPLEFLGFPLSRLHELPQSSKDADLPWGSELEHEVPWIQFDSSRYGMEILP